MGKRKCNMKWILGEYKGLGTSIKLLYWGNPIICYTHSSSPGSLCSTIALHEPYARGPGVLGLLGFRVYLNPKSRYDNSF